VAATEANLRAAQAGVWSASEQLDQTQNSIQASQVATARANLAAAQIQLEQARRVNEEEPNIDTHEAMLDAQEAVDIAQAELDELLAGPNEDAVAAARAEVGAAAAQRDARQADLDLLVRGSSEAQVAAAEANLAQAEATLVSLEEGPTAEEMAQAEARVEQARLSLAEAEAALAEATLRAPFAGTVTAVHVSEGELASGVAVELIEMDSLRVVLTVDEADVGALGTGQPAVVTLEAWPETEIESEILRIAPAATNDSSGLVSYEVHLGLAQTDLPVRAGMTASAQLITARRDGVLLVPNRAIIADRESGTYYVDLVTGTGEDETVERVEVTIGLRDDENTQITGGLESGDRLRIGRIQTDSVIGPGGPGGGPGQ
jgi:RND family efflux transporter MFP subunit